MTYRQIQNAAIAQSQGQGKPQIFKGLEIYVCPHSPPLLLRMRLMRMLTMLFCSNSHQINGYTVPPLDKLRTMIMQHGGTYIPYLASLRLLDGEISS